MTQVYPGPGAHVTIRQRPQAQPLLFRRQVRQRHGGLQRDAGEPRALGKGTDSVPGVFLGERLERAQRQHSPPWKTGPRPVPGPCDCDLIHRRGLCRWNQVKDLKMRSSCVTHKHGAGPKSNEQCPCKRQKGRDSVSPKAAKRGAQKRRWLASGGWTYPSLGGYWPVLDGGRGRRLSLGL